MNKAPTLSIVTPLFNEQDVIPIFFERMEQCLDNLALDNGYEIICVNDGSVDDSWQLLLAEHERNPNIKLINLSRNFGKEAALTAGLEHAQGQAVIPLDIDLQDPPELIEQMLEKWQQGFDVVLAKRADRSEDSVAKRFTANLFYRVLKHTSDIDIPENVGDFRLMDTKVVDALKRYPEKSRFMKGILASLGFRECVVEYQRPIRAAGTTKWNYFKLYKLALDGMVSFTTLPLKLWSYLGALTALGAFAYGFFLIARTLIFGVSVPGYASIMVVMLFMSGLILLCLGMIGEYLARIFAEVKNRPIYIVMDSIGFDEPKC